MAATRRRIRRAERPPPLGFAAADSPSTASPTQNADEAIEATCAAKRLGHRLALREVGFAATAGELLAVIGPNGAGKTTLLSLLARIRTPHAGTRHLPPGEVR